MKAVVYFEQGSPEVLQVAELPKPEPKQGEVLIKVGASGINPVDTYFRSGVRPVPSFPNIPHFDLGGTVVEVGEGVTKWKTGDKVWGTNVHGTSAEYVTASEDLLFPLADHLTEQDGAALAMAFMTAHLSLFYKGQLKEGETVLIYGAAGAVGHAAVQLAKQTGARVIATAGNKEKAEIAKNAGADFVINYKEEDLVAKVMELTDKTGVQLILDVSLSENIEQDLTMIEVGGRIVTIGSPKNNAPTLPWRLLNQKNASLLGILLFTAPKTEQQKAGEAVAKLFAENKLRAHIGKVFSFEEATQAHEALESHKYDGNIILIP